MEEGSELAFEVHSPDFPLPADVAEYARDKVTTKLQKHRRFIQDVTVWFRDVNGTKHGVDKSCHIEVRLNGLEPINVQETHEDLRAVLDLCIDRIEMAVERHVDKLRTKRVEKGRKMVRNNKLTT